MRRFAQRSYRFVSLLALVTTLGVTHGMAQEHVVTERDLSDNVREHQRKRGEDLRQVEAFFNSKEAGRALETAGMDSHVIRQAVPFLTDAELARLSSQAAKIQRDIAAGALTNQQLTYIVIALATAVVVILAS